MDKKKEKMTPERRYELACLILGGVVLGGALGCILRPNEWTFAVIPLLGVCLTALLWCAAARLWLCRDKQRLLAKSFTRPVRFALAVPAWAGATWLLYLLPGNVTGLDDVLAESVIILTLLAGTVFVPAAALGLGVASVLAAVVHLRRTPAAETRAYREGPLALALVLCVGVAALCLLGMGLPALLIAMLGFAAACALVALLANALAQLVRRAAAIKSENDLTI